MEDAIMGQRRPDAQRLTVWERFLTAHALIVRKLESELQAAEGLSLSEYEVLLRLYHAPQRRIRMGELAEAVFFSSGGLTRLLDRLEREGLVTRDRTCEDRRGVFAVLTEAGQTRMRQAARTHLHGIDAHFASALDDDELPAVDAFLTRLAEQATIGSCAPAEIASPA
jgi:DNA-binding MarR family transcriptional regulator